MCFRFGAVLEPTVALARRAPPGNVVKGNVVLRRAAFGGAVRVIE
jgi:hypothetical protein